MNSTPIAMVKHKVNSHNGLHSLVVLKEFSLVELVDEEGVEEVALGEPTKLAPS